ncbi:MAG: PAS domain-containing protein, partial [Candidatus Omnitrophica bacterium]|nr:PAS domain-containing protein [Candidatus Omnitrophota bacterium]
MARWLEEESPGLAGKNFDCLLRSRIPAWGKDLDEVWTDSSNLGRRRLKHDCTNGAQWYSLEVARNIAGWFIRLSSALPPHEELAGDAWDQHLGGVAERRQMYVRLLRAEAQLDNLVRRWPGVIFSQRADFSFQFVSPRIEELTGIPVELWRRQPKRFWEVIHEADVEEVKQQCKLAAESAQGVTNAYRIRHVRTGQLSYVLEHRQAVLSRTGLLLAYEGAWLDITRQTIAEKRLCTAAWKETLATLTMGLAHDFGNIISGIFSLDMGHRL